MVPRTTIVTVALIAAACTPPLAADELKNTAFTLRYGPSGITSLWQATPSSSPRHRSRRS